MELVPDDGPEGDPTTLTPMEVDAVVRKGCEPSTPPLHSASSSVSLTAAFGQTALSTGAHSPQRAASTPNESPATAPQTLQYLPQAATPPDAAKMAQDDVRSLTELTAQFDCLNTTGWWETDDAIAEYQAQWQELQDAEEKRNRDCTNRHTGHEKRKRELIKKYNDCQKAVTEAEEALNQHHSAVSDTFAELHAKQDALQEAQAKGSKKASRLGADYRSIASRYKVERAMTKVLVARVRDAKSQLGDAVEARSSIYRTGSWQETHDAMEAAISRMYHAKEGAMALQRVSANIAEWAKT